MIMWKALYKVALVISSVTLANVKLLLNYTPIFLLAIALSL